MIVGADTHKRSHTITAVDAATGQVLAEKTIVVGVRGLARWCYGLEVSAASGPGRSRIAGTSPGRLSGSSSHAASGWSASRPG